LYNGGFYTRAEIEYRRARELEPFNSENYRRLGQVYERENRLDLSLQAFLDATKRDGNSFRAWQNLGTFYWGRGNYEEAVRNFLICVHLAPDEADAHFALGTMYKQMGRYPEAEDELRKAIGISETPKALNNLAAALSYDGKDGEAIPFYLRALKASPDLDRHWMALADAYRRTNRKQEASEAYRRAGELARGELARNPSDDALRARMAYLRLRRGERAEAESEIGQAVHGTSDYNTLEMAVEVYELLGEHENAWAIWETFPYEIVLEISRNPDLADLRCNSRFQKLMELHNVRK
jgi:tetratricopeptide (TPR) repeat protein